jgi:hypothetical protein
MHWLNEPLNAPDPLPDPLYTYDPTWYETIVASDLEFAAATAAASAPADPSLDPHETSVPERIIPSYNDYVRRRDRAEWDAALETLISLHPLVSDKRIFRYKHCLDKAWFYRNKSTGEVAVFSGACKDRACPVCASRRSYDLSKKVSEWIAVRKHVRFATFTLRSNDKPLDDQISCLYSAFRKLRRDPRVRRALAAGIWFFQTTFNVDTQQWHPHLHCVTIGRYIPQAELSEAWLRASGDSYVVDLRYVCAPEKVAQYVARYAARPYRLLDLPRARRQEAVLAFFSRRLFGTWGALEARPRIKRDKADLSGWECLGSWSYVKALQGIDWRAEVILIAWQTRTPLQPGVSTYAWDHAVIWEGVREIVIDPAPG